jgi:hypothetical protein
LALINLSVVEQRYRAVLAVERDEPKIVVVAQFGVSRQALHTWLTRYWHSGLAGLMDRTHRPPSCPHQASAEVESRVCELRREHPRWGPRRIAHELAASAQTAAAHRGNPRCIAFCAAMASSSPAGAEGSAESIDAGNARRRWRYGQWTSSEA